MTKYLEGAKAAISLAGLKASGTIPLTDQEQFEKNLDRLHRDAQSEQFVEYEGLRHQRRLCAFSEMPLRENGNSLE